VLAHPPDDVDVAAPAQKLGGVLGLRAPQRSQDRGGLLLAGFAAAPTHVADGGELGLGDGAVAAVDLFEPDVAGGCQGQPGSGMNRKRAMSIRVAHHCNVDLADAAGFDTGRAQHASLDAFTVTGVRNAICTSWPRGALAFAAASRAARASAYICRMILLIRFPSSRSSLAPSPSGSQDESQSFWFDCKGGLPQFQW